MGIVAHYKGFLLTEKNKLTKNVQHLRSKDKLALLGTQVLMFAMYNYIMMSALEVPGVHVHVSHIQCLQLSHQVFLLLNRTEGRITFLPEISGLERLITKTYLIEIASEIVSFSPSNHRIRENSDPVSGS